METPPGAEHGHRGTGGQGSEGEGEAGVDGATTEGLA